MATASIKVGEPKTAPDIAVGDDPLVLGTNTVWGWSEQLAVVAGTTASDVDGDDVILTDETLAFIPNCQVEHATLAPAAGSGGR